MYSAEKHASKWILNEFNYGYDYEVGQYCSVYKPGEEWTPFFNGWDYISGNGEYVDLNGYYDHPIQPRLGFGLDGVEILSAIDRDTGVINVWDVLETPWDGDNNPPEWTNGVGIQAVTPIYHGMCVYWNKAVDPEGAPVRYRIYWDTENPIRFDQAQVEDYYSLPGENYFAGYDYLNMESLSGVGPYYVAVRAYDYSLNRNEEQNTVTMEVYPAQEDTTPPTWPTTEGLQFIEGISGGVCLYFNHAEDDLDPNLRYTVYWDTQTPVRWDSLAESRSGYGFLQPKENELGYECYIRLTRYFEAGQQYWFMVRAEDDRSNEDSNTTELSHTIWDNDPDQNPPVWPTTTGIQQVFTQGYNYFVFSWNAAVDPEDPEATPRYYIYVDDQFPIDFNDPYYSDWINSYSKSSGDFDYTSHAWISLPEDYDRTQPMYFAVRAEDGAGNMDANEVTLSEGFSEWTARTLTSDATDDPCMDHDPDGNVWLTFHDETTQELKLAMLDDGAFTPEIVDSGDIRHGALAFDSAGDPLLAYYRLNDAETWWEVRAAHRDGPGWLHRTVAVVDEPTLAASRVSLAETPTGDVGIAFHSPGGDMLWHGEWNGTLWFTEQATITPATGRWPSLGYLSDGTPLIAHYDAVKRDLLLTSGPGPAWTTEIVSSAGSVGSQSSLRILAEDRLVIGCFSENLGSPLFAYFSDGEWDFSYRTYDFTEDLRLDFAIDRFGTPLMLFADLTSGTADTLAFGPAALYTDPFESGVLPDKRVALAFEDGYLPAAAVYNPAGELRLHRLSPIE